MRDARLATDSTVFGLGLDVRDARVMMGLLPNASPRANNDGTQKNGAADQLHDADKDFGRIFRHTKGVGEMRET